MATNIRAVRGMNDILPNLTAKWDQVEKLLCQVVTQYGYQEIRLPLLEFTELFQRAIGEVTDIVEKEMYTFLDRNGESLTLRPEGTASCIRAGIEQGLLYNQVQRLFYYGPMFRYERPQKGRYRQFHQFGVEAYGWPGPDIDAEILLLAARLWRELNIASKLELQINTLGTAETRRNYREALINYLQNHYSLLDADSKRRLTTNPLRILDSKNPAMQELIKDAPKIFAFLEEGAHKHFTKLCALLDAANLPYVINPCLVRGLDYYGLTVFEWVTNELGAQSAVCAGGRYDSLVAQMGGQSTPAIGFAIGLERLLTLVGNSIASPSWHTVYLVLLGERAVTAGLGLAERIRSRGRVRVIVNCGGGSLKAQLKRADKSGATQALILGEEELRAEEIIIKELRVEQPQRKVRLATVAELF